VNLINKNGYFIDKSLFIKEIIEDLSIVKLITRPRRFGKTLNMSMLYSFLSNLSTTEEKTYFTKLKIWKEIKYRRYLSKYPVIFLTFKDVRTDNYETAIDSFKFLISETYKIYRKILFEGTLKDNEDDKIFYQKIINRESDMFQTEQSLKKLTEYLKKQYNSNVIILIDEYDTPIHESYFNGYYDKLIKFIRNLLTSSLKDNSNLDQAILTGVLRLAKESIFSGLNNIKVYGLLSDKYSEYFGFLEEEVKSMLKKEEVEKVLNDAICWYGGYRIGDQYVFNPWSITNFIEDNQGKEPFNYKYMEHWINTSENKIVNDLINKSSKNIALNFKMLLNNEKMFKTINEHVVFSDMRERSDELWSFLLLSGYLTTKTNSRGINRNEYELTIPNKEVFEFFKRTFTHSLCSKSEEEKTEFDISRKSYDRNLIKCYREMYYPDLDLKEEEYEQLVCYQKYFLYKITPEANYESYNETIDFEVKRCLTRLNCFNLLLKGDKESYQKFIKEQPEDKKLPMDVFFTLSKEAQQLDEDIKQAIRVSCLLVKSKCTDELIRDAKIDLEDDSEYYLTQAVNNQDILNLLPLTRSLKQNVFKFLKYCFWEKSHFRHMMYTEGRNNMTHFLNLLEFNDEKKGIDVWKWRWLINLMGFKGSSTAKYFHNETYIIVEKVICLLKQQKEIFLEKYLIERAKMAGFYNLNFNDREVKLLAHLAAYASEIDISTFDMEKFIILGYRKFKEVNEDINLAKLYEEFRENKNVRIPTYTPAVLNSSYVLLKNNLELAVLFTCQLLSSVYTLQTKTNLIISCRDIADKVNLKLILEKWQSADYHVQFNITENGILMIEGYGYKKTNNLTSIKNIIKQEHLLISEYLAEKVNENFVNIIFTNLELAKQFSEKLKNIGMENRQDRGEAKKIQPLDLCTDQERYIIQLTIDEYEALVSNKDHQDRKVVTSIAANFIELSKEGKIEVLQDLLYRHPDLINVQENKGVKTTALHWAVAFNNRELVKFLLNAGADVMIKDANGETPIQWINKDTDQDIIKLLNANLEKVSTEKKISQAAISIGLTQHEFFAEPSFSNKAKIYLPTQEEIKINRDKALSEKEQDNKKRKESSQFSEAINPEKEFKKYKLDEVVEVQTQSDKKRKTPDEEIVENNENKAYTKTENRSEDNKRLRLNKN